MMIEEDKPILVEGGDHTYYPVVLSLQNMVYSPATDLYYDYVEGMKLEEDDVIVECYVAF